jgi:hypothetical protein
MLISTGPALRAGTGSLWCVAEDARRLKTGEEQNSALGKKQKIPDTY